MDQSLKVKLLSPNGKLPTRSSVLAAGYDLYSTYDFWLYAGTTLCHNIGIAVQVPPGTYGRIAGRSGMAIRASVGVLGGVIDQDYRGEVGVILHNHGKDDVRIVKGERIAQLILERIMVLPVLEVKELDETVRGEGGFGSTGK
jgi:dUTP pyrophosphatase